MSICSKNFRPSLEQLETRFSPASIASTPDFSWAPKPLDMVVFQNPSQKPEDRAHQPTEEALRANTSRLDLPVPGDMRASSLQVSPPVSGEMRARLIDHLMAPCQNTDLLISGDIHLAH